MALILTRRQTQRVYIDGPCMIEVDRIMRNSVRLAFTAAGSVNVRREEVPPRDELERIPASILPRPIDPNIGLHCEV